jgi:uncharacterized membrane protein
VNHEKPPNLLRAELLIAQVLRFGVFLCLLVIGAGLALRLLHGESNSRVIGTLVSGLTAGDYHPPANAALLLYGAFHGNPDIVIALGLVMLIALPVIRVGLTTLIFFFEKDWAFFWITLFVLSVLLTGIFLGKAL